MNTRLPVKLLDPRIFGIGSTDNLAEATEKLRETMEKHANKL